MRHSPQAVRLTRLLPFLASAALGVCAGHAGAQIDPTRRDLVEAGYDQPIRGHAPIGAYVYYYFNRPQFGDAEHALRLAVSPVYIDGEWAIRGALGPDTDAGIGINGGGFAYSYNEIRKGHWLQDQSFDGHGGGASASVYHLFNPGARIPLSGILRGAFRYVAYVRSGDNPPDFAVSDNQPIASVRAGLRFGGIEPLLDPGLAAEVSAWYEAQRRLDPGPYGFADDRRVESTVQQFWARAVLVYTMGSGHEVTAQLTGGTSVHPDRLSAYRIGGVLSLASEFPLTVPGYYEGELSARNFILAGGSYAIPLDPARQWRLGVGASVAHLDFTPGLEQAHAWNSGASVSLGYARPADAWKALLVYGHAFDAIRNGHRGGDSVSLLMEFDLERMGYLESDATSRRPPQ